MHAYAGDGASATQASIFFPTGLGLAPDGSLYIADERWVRKVDLNGNITTFAGDGSRFQFAGDGGPARLAKLHEVSDVAVGKDGMVYLADKGNNRVRRVDLSGIITTAAGNGQSGAQGDLGAATQARLSVPYAIAVQPDGNLLIADHSNNRIRAVVPALPGMSNGETLLASENGAEVYLVDPSGRHLRTLHALTGDTLLKFGYDAAGLLVTLTDGNDNVTTVERDGGGNPTGIVGPYGQRTALGLNADGYLHTITNPNNEQTTLTYHTGGLLATLTDARLDTYLFTYDGEGRLIRDDDPAGGFTTLVSSQSGNANVTTVATAMNRVTSYQSARLASSALRSLHISPTGYRKETVASPNDSVRTVEGDGTVTTLVYGADPIFGSLRFPKNMTIRMPSGLQFAATASRSASFGQAGNPFSLVATNDTTRVNGRIYVTKYSAAAMTYTLQMPSGRQNERRFDSQGRLSEIATPGRSSVLFSYDEFGGLERRLEGNRETLLAYDSLHRVASIRDPLSRVSRFDYDAADRIVAKHFNDGAVVQFAYDSVGNMIALTPASKPAHKFAYNDVGLLSMYEAPAIGGDLYRTHFEYNLDRQVERIISPDSQAIEFEYDSKGQLATLAMPGVTQTFEHHDSTGNLMSITGGEVELRYTYDGSLPLSVNWSGAVNGTVAITYDSDLRAVSQSLNGSSLPFQYDADGLLTAVGAMSLTRRPDNGMISATSVGNVVTAIGHNEFGEHDSVIVTMGSAVLFKSVYSRDKLGRIVSLHEQTQENATVKTFDYDSAGRLAVAIENGIPTAAYDYDRNGNRSTVTTAQGITTATTDAQDRLTTYGDASYEYTRSGARRLKVQGGDSTRYRYNAAGALVAAYLPFGDSLTYILDGRNRRVGVKRNGQFTKGWLYAGDITPIAELDSLGIVASRFVYGSKTNVPDYMIRDGVIYAIISDHVGSVRQVVNSQTGTIVQEIEYDAFGAVLMNTNHAVQPFGFAGGITDPETGLVHFGSRDYDPATGGWTSKDPLGFSGAEANLYSYVFSDPVTYVDTDGLCPRPMQEEDPECPEGSKRPAKGPITSAFGDTTRPAGSSNPHGGTDIGCKAGDTITPLAPGKVTGSNTNSETGGTMAVVTHPGGYTSRYLHMEKGSLNVKYGEKVTTDTKLGTCGKTGEADGVHLHIDMKHNKKPVDPGACFK